jgi:alpha-beta hydrolase superfamily lysophospholipase
MQLAFNRRTLSVSIAGVAIAAVVGGCAALDVKQREWIFNPSKTDWGGFAGLPAGSQEFWLDVNNGKSVATRENIPVAKDGEAQWIHAWWMPAEVNATGGAKDAPVMLYLHGARWNLTGSTWRTQKWREAGFSILAIDYRGFGQSEGDVPSEKQSYEDARAAWNWLKKKQPDAKKRLIYGHSLGGAVAIDLATHVGPGEAAGLITEATFTSISDMIKTSQWGFLPVGFLITQRFESQRKIAKIKLPKLFIHGTADRIVPFRMSEALYDAAPEPKRLIKVPGAGHSNVVWTDFDPVRLAALEMVGMPATEPAPLKATLPAVGEDARGREGSPALNVKHGGDAQPRRAPEAVLRIQAAQ